MKSNTPKLKPTTKKKSISAKNTGVIDASDPIINVAGSWKSSVDLTLARHGKEIALRTADISAAGLKLEQHRKALNTQKEIIDDILDELRSHSGYIRETRERLYEHNVWIAVNTGIIIGLIAAVGYLLYR